MCGEFLILSQNQQFATDAFKLLFLQHEEQLGLHHERHFADLIEKIPAHNRERGGAMEIPTWS